MRNLTFNRKIKIHYSIFFGIFVLLLSGCSQISDNQSKILEGGKLKIIISFTAKRDELKVALYVDRNAYACVKHTYESKWADLVSEEEIKGIEEAPLQGKLNIFDGANNLIGVPDIFFVSGVPTLENCEVTYLFSNTNFGNSPIVVKANGSLGSWNIPKSDWQDGVVNLDGSGLQF